MNILNIEHIHKIFGDKVIFDDISCGIDQGEKIGIIGVHDKRSWCSDKYDARDRGRIRPGVHMEPRSENRRCSYYEKSTICDT